MTKHTWGWTRQPAVVAILELAIARFNAVYPWATRESAPLSASCLLFVMFTASEVLALDPCIPVSMHPEEGHNDGPLLARMRQPGP